jgi:hypothetical protein
MNHKVLTPIQRSWLKWLLREKFEWEARWNKGGDRKVLEWVSVNGVYDIVAGGILNGILKAFNEDEEAKRRWDIWKDTNKSYI